MPFDNTHSDTTERVVSPTCTCETCKLRRFEGSKLRHAVVHSYSYRPRNWRLNAVRGETPTYYLGVELETDRYRLQNGAVVYSEVGNQIAADMRRPKNLWFPKSDASVSGPEFVSHPSTLRYWQKQKKALAEMFQMLVHAGYRSHDTDRAGMHVNISRSAFADPAHLYRFLSLIHTSPTWSLKMSQRTASSASHWARLDVLSTPSRRESEATRLMDSPVGWRQYPGSAERYQALNAPSGQPRFEFRLPRGTLRVDRFYKNLEWTAAMIEYARDGRLADMVPVRFMRWVLTNENRATYPHLAKFLSERFDNIIFVTEDDAITNPPEQESMEGVRISPRTGRPVRQYRRREGSRPPGRPVGHSPSRTRELRRSLYAPALDGESVCLSYGEQLYRCERPREHTGEHCALMWQARQNRIYWL